MKRVKAFLKAVKGDLRAWVVTITVGAMAIWGWNTVFQPQPSWKKVWHQVDVVNDANPGDPKNWVWSPQGIVLTPEKCGWNEMRIIGLPEGKTVLNFSKRSMRLTDEGNSPRIGTVVCGHHKQHWQTFSLILADFNFVCVQLRDREKNEFREFWFRIDEGNTEDSQGLRRFQN